MSNLLGYAAAIPCAIVGLLISTFFGDIFSRLLSSLVDIFLEWIFSIFPILRKESASVDAASDGCQMNSDICKVAMKEAIVEVTMEAKRKATEVMKETILEVTMEAKEKTTEAMKDTILEVTKEAKEKTAEAILKVTKKAKEKTSKVTTATLFPNASSLHNRAQKIHVTPYLKRYAKSYCISDESSSPDCS